MLISLVKREAPDWSRELIRGIVDQIYKLAVQQPLQQTRLFDSTTGKDPTFTTTATTFEYRANTTTMTNLPYDAWFVDKVYSGVVGSSTYDEKEVFCTKGDYSNAALIRFRDDPGADTLYIRAFKKPTSISSESIELVDLSEDLHLDLYEGVMAWIEKTDNGKSQRWLEFEGRNLPKIWDELNKGIGQQTQPNNVGGF